ncbi:serine/threonine dehydratase [Actinomadura rubrisoli]|uniref:Pyridoxal-phosphate dependent enzyme n=1 Tax=Actinomadura rubrisoli TaxID=2530368 RepID=A0A4R5C066_9ACTN|nr:serine/threonine dehydratase [Actinomadura rubrisoli]TDD91140.1 pyridoxal-phosphate dependent enzyme [Actinomadura rubrisoli]
MSVTDVPVPTSDDVAAAADRIRGHVRRTPLVEVASGTFGVGAPLVLKLELLQHSGSFKPRGVFNRALTQDVPSAGLVIASGGNAALALLHVGERLGHAVEVFVPETAPAVKIAKLRRHGARVHQAGRDFAEAVVASEHRAAETGALLMHAYDQMEVVAGQGTVGLELGKQCPDVDTVLVACGGGGLAGGIAAWFDRRVRVVAVEASGSPTLAASRAAGERVTISVGGVAADALGASRIGAIAWEIARRAIDEVVVVPGEAILDARRRLWDELRICAEPGAAAPLAALVGGGYVPEAYERVAVIVCGGNSDPASLS